VEIIAPESLNHRLKKLACDLAGSYHAPIKLLLIAPKLTLNHEHMAFMIDHCVYSQVVWIWKTGLTYSALKRVASNIEHLVNRLPSLPL
jgi:hypothetical protein